MKICKSSTQPLALARQTSTQYSSNLKSRGFTLIELMIVIAVLAILLSLAIPVYSNYAVRAKIGEGLAVAKAAKTATGAACQENRNLADLTNSAVGYPFIEASGDDVYVANIAVSGACAEPIITVTTKNTGAEGPDPIITLSGDFPSSGGQVQWTCASDNTPDHLLPGTCRSSS